MGISEESVSPVPVAWRLGAGMFGGVPLCDVHKVELEQYLDDPLFRPVMGADELAELAELTNLPFVDICALYGRRLAERCSMCDQVHVDGNHCQHCYRELHPRWSAEFCSDACALAGS